MKPTAERVRDLLHYDHVTGVFIWKSRGVQRWDSRWAGKIAGSAHSGGYTAIAIDRVKYLAHHLAWVYMTGDWPTEIVDHKNLNKKNNAWQNLRDASTLENSANASIRSDNKSGFRGVCFKRGVWHANINKDGRQYFLGSFLSVEDAGKAYAAKARELYGEYCPQYLIEGSACHP